MDSRINSQTDKRAEILKQEVWMSVLSNNVFGDTNILQAKKH